MAGTAAARQFLRVIAEKIRAMIHAASKPIIVGRVLTTMIRPATRIAQSHHLGRRVGEPKIASWPANTAITPVRNGMSVRIS